MNSKEETARAKVWRQESETHLSNSDVGMKQERRMPEVPLASPARAPPPYHGTQLTSEATLKPQWPD